VFYLGSSEWCHVQRDPWMLLPAMAALYLRRQSTVRPSVVRSVAEGMFWAAAFWIKPFVAVPALISWLASARLARIERQASIGSIAFDGFGVLAGGIIVGAAGVAWMIASGAWPHFVAMSTDWNREYFAYDVTEGRRWWMAAGFVVRSFPWVLIHLAAIPIGVRDLWRERNASAVLLSALYLGWLVQGFLLQHLFDYVHAPAMLLGFAVVFGRVTVAGPLPQRLFAAFLVMCVMFRVPILLREPLRAWPKCWTEGSSPAVRDQTGKIPAVHRANWRELQGVSEFLRHNNVRDGELTCFNMPTTALLRELDVEAATRYHFFQNNWLTFRRHRPRIYADLAASRQRYVVIDLLWRQGIALKDPDLDQLPPRWERWKSRIVYQSGRYVVLEMTGAETSAWLEECFD
jgi:hypothetical protein